MPRTYRVVVGRRGSDLEQLRADLVARALRDAGCEVIYASPSAGLDQLAEAVLQEDADAVGVSAGAAGESPEPAESLRGELAARGLQDVVVFSTDGDPAEVAAGVVSAVGAAAGPGLGLDGDS